MDSSGRIPWAVLGLAEDASFDDARRAFRGLVKRAHPDAGGDAAVFAALVDAFRAIAAGTDRLSDAPAASPLRRRTPYDWTVDPGQAAPHVWAEERPVAGRSLAGTAGRAGPGRSAGAFSQVLERELAYWSNAA